MTRIFNRWILVAGAAIIIWAGTISSGFGFLLPPREGPVGEEHRPVIRAIVAQNEIGIGYLWKIYIHATDPDGDIDQIYVYFAQSGGSYTSIPLVLRRPVKELNGAVLTWTTLAGINNQMGAIYASAEIVVEDRAGNMSVPKTIEFTLGSFGPEDKFVPPPPIVKNIVYGQVDFPIQSEDDVVGDDGGDRGD